MSTLVDDTGKSPHGLAGASSGSAISVQGVSGGVAQPVSGTVTANVGTTNGLALDATLTGGTQKTKLVDTGGTNVASISASGALAVTSAVPATANILAGSVTTTGGTIITIPVGRVWVGVITLSAGLAPGAAAQTATPTITIQSAGTSFPASATVLARVDLLTVAGVTTPAANGNVSLAVTIAAPGATNAATLQLNAGGGTAPTSMIGMAEGLLQ